MQLQKFADNLWVAEGAPIKSIGPWKHSTRMIVVRLADGSLWINSPIAASAAEMRALEKVGLVRYLIAPARFHVWRLEAWKVVFPEAEVWGPPGVGSTFRGVTFDHVLGETPPATWAADLDQMIFRCSPFFEEVEFLHRASRTLIIGDYIQEPRSPLSYVTRPFVQFSRIRRSIGRRSRAELLSWDFDALIVAHGPRIKKGAKMYVERSFEWL